MPSVTSDKSFHSNLDLQSMSDSFDCPNPREILRQFGKSPSSKTENCSSSQNHFAKYDSPCGLRIYTLIQSCYSVWMIKTGKVVREFRYMLEVLKICVLEQCCRRCQKFAQSEIQSLLLMKKKIYAALLSGCLHKVCEQSTASLTFCRLVPIINQKKVSPRSLMVTSIKDSIAQAMTR